MLTTSYAPEHDPLQLLKRQNRGVISAYAARRDYHDVVKKRLKVLARWLVAETGCDVKVFVDTAPVMEKPLAAAAGVGWQGKHTILSADKMEAGPSSARSSRRSTCPEISRPAIIAARAAGAWTSVRLLPSRHPINWMPTAVLRI